ncbi:hypothetical protein JI747_016995 [Chryseobacterium sp. RG1]|uniref:Uncharacterized protein n=1 Tax=Chryseobacterium tagetis TaxID=2801334 RepID=A0ABS8A7E9_9FLAO|nr:hypothetical protein [Chryseobacterium tagetis]MCA6068865.1 hypothetical protein [Chryseobacterium tagetis]
MKNLYIPEPCSENWEMMSPQEKGRFCSVCNKCVIDFTQKQSEEIFQIINEKKDGEVCGRFYNYQLSNKESKSEKLKTKLFKNIPSSIQNNRIILAVFSFILFLTGCSKQKEESCTMTTGVLVSDIEMDTVKNKSYVMGEAVIPEDQQTTKIHKKDSVALKGKLLKK